MHDRHNLNDLLFTILLGFEVYQTYFINKQLSGTITCVVIWLL